MRHMSIHNNPLVSVVMPCYNDGKYIGEAIESLKAQTYSPVELIVVDDGSDDEQTKKLLSEIDFPQFKLIRTERSYPAAARNKGAEHAAGKYLLPLDADDRIEPLYIEKAVEVLEKQENVGAVYCHANCFGEKTGAWQLPEYEINEMLIDNIVFVTALIRKETWEEIGGFDETFVDGLEDYDFFLSLIEKNWTIVQLPDYLFNYRIKSKSRSTQFAQSRNAISETYRHLYNKHLKLYQRHIDTLFPSMREDYLQLRNRRNNAEQEVELFRNLVYEKGPRAFARLLFYRYKRRPKGM